MIVSRYAAETNSAPQMGDWMEILQKNAKSPEQIQAELLKGATDTVKEVQEKAAEMATEKAQEGDESSESSTTVNATKADGIKDPSDVTKQDLQSPVDIKL